MRKCWRSKTFRVSLLLSRPVLLLWVTNVSYSFCPFIFKTFLLLICLLVHYWHILNTKLLFFSMFWASYVFLSDLFTLESCQAAKWNLGLAATCESSRVSADGWPRPHRGSGDVQELTGVTAWQQRVNYNLMECQRFSCCLYMFHEITKPRFLRSYPGLLSNIVADGHKLLTSQCQKNAWPPYFSYTQNDLPSQE